MHDSWENLFDVGKDILSAEADSKTGAIVCQVGNATDSTADSDKAEVWAPAGYYAVPSAPTKGQPSTQAVSLRYSDHDVIIATRDPRDAKVVGNLKPGDRVIAGGYPAQSRVYVRADGTVTLSAKDDNTADGNDVYYRLATDESRFWSPWGSVVHDHTGYHVRTFHGAKLDLSGLGLPAPFNSYGSSAMLTADIVSVNGAIVQLGRDQGTSQALAQVLALSTQLAAVCNQILGVFATFTGSGTFPGVAAATSSINGILGALTATAGTKAVTGA